MESRSTIKNFFIQKH